MKTVLHQLACALVLFVAPFALAQAATCTVNDVDIANEYTGPCKNGLADGQGTAKGRDTYQGGFKNGNKHGKGIYIWPDGGRYEGEYREDLPSGKGIRIWPNGARYEGEYREGRPSGKGIYVHLDGSRSEGEWVDGKRNGFGTITVPRSGHFDEKERSKLGVWIGDNWVERGMWRNDVLQMACSSKAACEAKEKSMFKRLACVTWNNSYSNNPFFKNADVVEHKITANMLEKSDDQCEVKIRSQKLISLVSGDPPYRDNDSVVVDCIFLSPCN